MELHTHNLLERWLLSASMMAVVGGFALQASEAAAEEPIDNPEFAAVVVQPNSYLGDQVRWGGTITAVENRGRHDTVLVIANKALDSQGRPLAAAGNQGRFMARVNDFLNPTVYAKGQPVTVTGILMGSTSRAIDNNSDSYPFVAVNNFYLWPELEPTTDYRYACDTGMSPYPDTSFGYGQGFHLCD